MKKVFLLSALTTCLSLAQAQAAVTGPTPSPSPAPQTGGSQWGNPSNGSRHYAPPPTTYDTQGTYGNIDDQSITTQVQNTLGSYQSKYSNVTVSVASGNVTLKGSVNSQEDKDNLGALVGGINGVRSINNQVTVQGSSQNPQNYSNGSNNSYQGQGSGSNTYQNGNNPYGSSRGY